MFRHAPKCWNSFSLDDIVVPCEVELAIFNESKFMLNILKFEEKYGNGPTNHMIGFPLWCCLNSLMDNNIGLILF